MSNNSILVNCISPDVPSVDVKVLEDSDTLESRKISDGAAIHLFQRPKSATLAGVGTASASQSGRLHEIPPLLLQVQERLRGSRVHSQGQGYLDAHWEVEVPRRSIRFLASFLLLMSVMQVTSRGYRG